MYLSFHTEVHYLTILLLENLIEQENYYEFQTLYILLGLLVTSSCYCSDERVDLEKNITEINFNESGPIQVTFSNNSHNQLLGKMIEL